MSGVWYEGAHSVTFISSSGVRKNTWIDWHLIPAERPVVTNPGVSTNFVEVPGRGTPIDLSTYLTGSIIYGGRSGSWNFYIINENANTIDIYNSIVEFVHGQRLKVALGDMPNRYFEGRFSVDTLKNSDKYSSVSISYSLDPYPQIITASDNWDDFITGG
jgi:hypothetical protein